MSEDLLTPEVIVYGHSTCPGVGPVKAMLKRTETPFKYINIRQDASASEIVREINNGNESVPTLVFPDGTTMTEPTAGQLKTKLEEMGYKVDILALLMANIWNIVLIALILFAGLRFLGVILNERCQLT